LSSSLLPCFQIEEVGHDVVLCCCGSCGDDDEVKVERGRDAISRSGSTGHPTNHIRTQSALHVRLDMDMLHLLGFRYLVPNPQFHLRIANHALSPFVHPFTISTPAVLQLPFPTSLGIVEPTLAEHSYRKFTAFPLS
jgi:hypothetical protein